MSACYRSSPSVVAGLILAIAPPSRTRAPKALGYTAFERTREFPLDGHCGPTNGRQSTASGNGHQEKCLAYLALFGQPMYEGRLPGHRHTRGTKPPAWKAEARSNV